MQVLTCRSRVYAFDLCARTDDKMNGRQPFLKRSVDAGVCVAPFPEKPRIDKCERSNSSTNIIRGRIYFLKIAVILFPEVVLPGLQVFLQDSQFFLRLTLAFRNAVHEEANSRFFVSRPIVRFRRCTSRCIRFLENLRTNQARTQTFSWGEGEGG